MSEQSTPPKKKTWELKIIKAGQNHPESCLAKKEPHLCAVLFQTLPIKKKTSTWPNTAQIYHPLLICLTFHSEQNETINSGEAANLDMFQSCTRSQLQCICQTSPDFRKPRVVSLISFHFFVRQFFAKQLKESTHHVGMPCNHLLNLMDMPSWTHQSVRSSQDTRNASDHSSDEK